MSHSSHGCLAISLTLLICVSSPSYVTAEESASCPLLFVPAEHSDSPAVQAHDWRKTLSNLDRLPPVGLDTPTLKEGLANFWREMRKLNKGFAYYDQIREELKIGALSPADAQDKISALASASARAAERELSRHAENTPRGRKALEAHRLLLQGLSNLDRSAAAAPPKSDLQKRREELAKKK